MAKTPSRIEEVYERLRSDLISGAIMPGERLNTLRLAERFGMSQSVIREALSRLTADGLTITLHRRGFRAAPISVREMTQVADALAEIEAICLSRSMQAGGSVWVASVTAAHAAFADTPFHVEGEGPGVSERFVEAYSRFRTALVSACDNEVLLRLRSQALVLTERHSRICAALGAKTGHLSEAYLPLMAAIAAGDEARATALLASQLRANTVKLAEMYKARLGWVDALDDADAETAEPVNEHALKAVFAS